MTDADPFPHFSRACKREFAFLVERYGFVGPAEEQLGHERFIQYGKRDRFVSISYEPRSKPVVEFFSPTLAIKHRRSLSRPTIPLDMPLPKVHRDWSEDEIGRYLRWCAVNLEANDRDFLTP